MNAFNEQFRFGSAAWSGLEAAHRAGLTQEDGPVLGFLDGRILRIPGDSPIITIGGAGGGKLRDVLAFNLCGVRSKRGKWIAPPRMLVNDPRGELAAISIHNQVRLGKSAYCINPFALHGLPRLRVNPWALIDPKQPAFHADIKLLVADLITRSGSPTSEYFELRAREWCEALVKMLVHYQGSVTMPDLYDIVNDLESADVWERIREAMLATPYPDVAKSAREIHEKRENAPKEYGGITGEIHKSLSFMSIPAVRETLSASDFSLDVLCKENCNVYLMIPAEYAEILAPMQRAIVGAAMLHKQRIPSAPRVLFLIDEAAQLGRFESLLRGYSYGRGMGIRMWSVWQDTGQIARNFGRDALSGFLGSSQTRQFFAVRDLETAQMVSKMLGTQTLEYDAELDQAAARRNKAHIVRQLMDGEDPFEAGLNYAQQDRASVSRVKQARALMAPDEVLSMPENRQILFVSGLGLSPIYAEKYPYFTRAELAGGFMPNPYHPPIDKVRLPGFCGPRWHRVITERVPARFSHLPQYQSGEWSYIEAYKPKA